MPTTRERRTNVLELADGYETRPQDDVLVYERPEEFESFYRRELPGMLVLGRVLAGPELAGEVAQETMLAGYRRWDEVRCRRSPAAWMRGLCMEQALHARRRRRREQRLLRALGSFRGSREDRRERRDVLCHAVQQLPEPQAEVVAAHYALGLDVEGVAEVLGKPEDVVLADIAYAQALLASRRAEDPAALDRALRVAGEMSRRSVAREVDVESDLENLQLAKVRRRRVHVIGSGLGALMLAVLAPWAPGTNLDVDAGSDDVVPASPVTPSGPHRPAGHTGLWRSDWVDR